MKKTIEDNLNELDNCLAGLWITRGYDNINAEIIFWGMSGGDHGRGTGTTFVEALNDLFEDLDKPPLLGDRPALIEPDWNSILEVYKAVQNTYSEDQSENKPDLLNWIIKKITP